MFDFIDTKTFLTIIHLFGVALGAGGAFASDFMFFSSVKDEKISITEMRFLKLGSKMIWAGIAILLTSGLFLFLGDTEQYLNSSKFLAKMTIVGVVIINGIIFHLIHIPHLRRHEEGHFPSSDEFVRKLPHLIASGAISMVSWTFAIILGALRSIPYSYGLIISVYIIVVVLAVVFGIIFKKYLMPVHHKQE